MLDTGLSILFGLVFIAFGVFCGGMAVQIYYRYFREWRDSRRSRSWSTSEGRVVSANLAHIGYRAGWKAEIQYEYTVGSALYTGERIKFDTLELYSLRDAQGILERYPLHSLVQVYYDPGRPQQATLMQDPHRLGCGMLLMPVLLLFPTAVCIGAGLMGLVSSVKK